MSSHHTALSHFLKRLLLTAPLFAAAWAALHYTPSLLTGILAPIISTLLSIAGAIILAPSIAQLLAEPVGDFFFPEKYNSKPVPMYSIPEGLCVSGRYDEAIREYMKIASKHRGEAKPYVEAVSIALLILRDHGQAQMLYESGMASLKGKKARVALANMYDAMQR